VNQYESQSLKEELENYGIRDDAPDIIVINSCTVTAESDRKTRQTVHRARKENPDAVIVLTGCMAQTSPAQAAKLPCDIILGNTASRNLPQAVAEFLKENNRIEKVGKHQKDEPYSTPPIKSGGERTRAYVKIEDGCNRGCAYCIIPKARGRVRSRTVEDIALEAKDLAAAGYCEIVLVGINLSSYEYGLENAVKAAAQDGIKRVRLGSLEPDLTTVELVKKLTEIPRFCPQFHLALQSGCDRTLKKMNRLYNTEYFLSLVNDIKKICPRARFTTDIMVGFSGETEQDFYESVAFCQKVGFLKMHVFPYSVREGTFAASFDGQVSKQEKSRRAAIMRKAGGQMTDEILKTYLNKTVEVLVESNSGGYTDDYVFVNLCGKPPATGQMVCATVTQVKNGELIAEIIE
ncbi:MAG: tRNA (N(6)-L-threonylcarbamoyladenosine(37)-C(2))-methylthiotransferase MtaB, partial [Oscillospiraceae bacterium]|nr:tRNA (N(6)-L-threonylcarbamoyladenosine(37)-C(2))-methylthiotransferase MtaB [Candidatus Equicaccousia limihippi]